MEIFYRGDVLNVRLYMYNLVPCGNPKRSALSTTAILYSNESEIYG
jgi:hypothetical protein